MAKSASPRPAASGTASPEEVARFTAMADAWWDPEGDFRPLHRFNPTRLTFVRDHLARHFGRDVTTERPFAGLRLLDVGCGGGLLSEPLARLGFSVTGIDAGERNVAVARLHAERSDLPIDYRVATPEDMAGEEFDVVMIMEIVEHVPDLGEFLGVVAPLVRPGGALFAATLNRTMRSYALGIVAAEYVMGWLPRGTHDWKKFVKPSELAAHLRRHGVVVKDLKGMSYDLARDEWKITADLGVNYMAYAARD